MLFLYFLTVQVPYYFQGYAQNDNVFRSSWGLPSLPILNSLASSFCYADHAYVLAATVMILSIFGSFCRSTPINLSIKGVIIGWSVFTLVFADRYMRKIAPILS